MSEMKDAAIEFVMDGKRYGATLPAESLEDAKKRLAAIRMTGTVEGWPCYSVSMPGPLAYLALPFIALWCGLLNLLERKSKP